MLLPYGDTNIPGAPTPVVTYLLIAACVAAFVYEVQLTPDELEALFYRYGFVPAGGLDKSTVITGAFLHGGFAHLIGNMLFLWLFGDNIEQTVGRPRYVAFYFAGAVVAALAHYLSNPASTLPAVGASGAIAAVMGAYIVLFPHSQIRMLWLFFPFRISAVLFLGVWIAQQLFSGAADLGVPTEDTAGVAWWAHIGGFAFGVVCGFFFRRFKAPESPAYAGNPWQPRPGRAVPLRRG